MRVVIGISLFWVPLALLTDGLTTLVLPVQLNRAGEDSATALGLISFAALLAGALTQLVAGTASDRLRAFAGRGGVLMAGVLSTVAGLVLLGMASTAVAIALAFLLVQIAVAVAQAAQQGYLPDQIPPRARGLASGLKGLADVGGAAVGFILLGALLEGPGPRAAVAVVGVMAVGALLATRALVREPRDVDALRPVAARPTLRGIVRVDLRRDRAFLVAVAARFLFLLPTFAVGRFFLFFVEDRILPTRGDAAAEAGAFLGVFGLVTAVSAPAGGWAADRWSRPLVMRAGCLVSAVGAVVLPAVASVGGLLVAGGLLSVGSGVFGAANWAQAADTAAPTEAGRYLAIANLGTAGASATAGLFAPVVDRGGSFGGGYGVLFLACAVLFLAAAAVVGQSPPNPAASGSSQSHPRVAAHGEGL